VVQNAEDEVNRLEDEMDAAAPNAQILARFQDQLKTIREEIKQYEGLRMEGVSRRDDINLEQATRLQKLKDLRADIQEVGARLKKAKDRSSDLDRKRQDILLVKNQADTKIEHAKADLAEAERALELQKERVKLFTEEANKVSSRVEIAESDTWERLNKEIEETQKIYADTERRYVFTSTPSLLTC
jgi:uncharacterized protein (DUF342 family)